MEPAPPVQNTTLLSKGLNQPRKIRIVGKGRIGTEEPVFPDITEIFGFGDRHGARSSWKRDWGKQETDDYVGTRESSSRYHNDKSEAQEGEELVDTDGIYGRCSNATSAEVVTALGHFETGSYDMSGSQVLREADN